MVGKAKEGTARAYGTRMMKEGRIPMARTISRILVLSIPIFQWGSAVAGPRLEVDLSDATSLRLCSKNYRETIRLRNIGDAELIISDIRPLCNSCLRAYLPIKEVQPGKEVEMFLTAKISHGERLPVEFYISSNDQLEPLKKVSYSLPYSPSYTCDISWVDDPDGKRRRYPFDFVLLESPVKPGFGVLQMTLMNTSRSNHSKEVGVTFSSTLFGQMGEAIGHDDTLVVLADARIKKPGVYHDYLRFVVDGRDLVVIPIQIVWHDSARPKSVELSFGRLAKGRSTHCVVEIVAPENRMKWQNVSLQIPEMYERAVSVNGIETGETNVNISLSIDGRFLGERGPKLIPVTMTNGEQVVRCWVYGLLY